LKTKIKLGSNDAAQTKMVTRAADESHCKLASVW